MRIFEHDRVSLFLASIIDAFAEALLVALDFLLEVIGTLVFNSGMGLGLWIFAGLWILARSIRHYAYVQTVVLQQIRRDAQAVALRRELERNTAIQKRIVEGLVAAGYLDDEEESAS